METTLTIEKYTGKNGAERNIFNRLHRQVKELRLFDDMRVAFFSRVINKPLIDRDNRINRIFEYLDESDGLFYEFEDGNVLPMA